MTWPPPEADPLPVPPAGAKRKELVAWLDQNFVEYPPRGTTADLDEIVAIYRGDEEE